MLVVVPCARARLARTVRVDLFVRNAIARFGKERTSKVLLGAEFFEYKKATKQLKTAIFGRFGSN